LRKLLFQKLERCLTLTLTAVGQRSCFRKRVLGKSRGGTCSQQSSDSKSQDGKRS
jgi:hypothetical protein